MRTTNPGLVVGTLLFIIQLSLCLPWVHFQFPANTAFSPAELQRQNCNTKVDSQSRCFMIELSQPKPSSFTIELFSLNKVSPFTTPQIGNSCWRWTGDDDLWLTKVISRRKMKVPWRKVQVQSDHDLLAFSVDWACCWARRKSSSFWGSKGDTASSWRHKVCLFLFGIIDEKS